VKRRILLLVVLAAAIACHKRETPAPKAPAQTRGVSSTGTEAPTPPTPATSTGTAVGSAMPAFTADLLDGKKFDVAAEKGNVVLLNLWATWCGPCRFEIPELEAMHNKLAPRGFKVVGVSLDESGRDAVKEFVEQHKMTYPIALDPEGKLANIFQTTVIPTSVVIDRGGKIVWKHYGLIEANDPELAKAVEKALGK